MEKLNFPTGDVRFKNKENKPYIFDPIRKKWLHYTPEEWVRVHCLNYLTNTLQYPSSWIKVENEIKLYNTLKRFDILIVNPNQGNLLLVECKAPSVKIDQKVFDQLARYNLPLKSEYMMVTNGLTHFFCTMDYDHRRYHFIRELPKFAI
jgi:ABC-type transporter lipoprotein component MlaA